MDLLALYNVDLRVCAIWPMLRYALSFKLYTFFLSAISKDKTRARRFFPRTFFCVCAFVAH